MNLTGSQSFGPKPVSSADEVQSQASEDEDSQNSLSEGLRVNSDARPSGKLRVFFCRYCSLSTSNSSVLKDHVEDDHPDEQLRKETLKIPTRRTVFQCRYCVFKTNFPVLMKSHCDKFHPAKSPIKTENPSVDNQSENGSYGDSNRSLPASKSDGMNESREIDESAERLVGGDVLEQENKEDQQQPSSKLNSCSIAIGGFVCQMCDFKATEYSILARHVETKHSIVELIAVDENIEQSRSKLDDEFEGSSCKTEEDLILELSDSESDRKTPESDGKSSLPESESEEVCSKCFGAASYGGKDHKCRDINGCYVRIDGLVCSLCTFRATQHHLIEKHIFDQH